MYLEKASLTEIIQVSTSKTVTSDGHTEQLKCRLCPGISTSNAVLKQSLMKRSPILDGDRAVCETEIGLA